MNRIVLLTAVALTAVSANATFETASPESEGVSSESIMRFADGLEKKGLNPQCYLVLRHGKRVSYGQWGDFGIGAPQELKGLTRILGLTVAGLAVDEGLLEDDATTDRLLGRLLAPGSSGVAAGDELGRLVEKKLGESPAYYLTQRMLFRNLKGNGWDWGGRAGIRGEFRFGTGAWMHPDLLMRIGQVYLEKGDLFKRHYFKPDWVERHPFGVRAYDGRLLAISPEHAAVVVLFADTTDDAALKAYVAELLAAFADAALPENTGALQALRGREKRTWTGSGLSAPASYPPVPKAPPTYGKTHAVLEMPPSGRVGRNSEGDLVKLKDGRLLLAWSQMLGSTADEAEANLMKRYSSDGGKTWTKEEIMVAKPPKSQNVMCVNFVRLKSGDLGLFYLDKKGWEDCRPVMRVSKNEGETWSEPRQIVPDAEVGYMVLNNARVRQMSDGRLVVPVAINGYSKSIPCTIREGWRTGGGIIAFYSDDEGLTWKRSKKAICPRDARGVVVCSEEPGVVELKDGRYLVYFRTNDNYQYFAWSSDRGETWTKARRSTMRSPETPATVERLSDGKLYAVWNDHSRDPGFRFRSPYFNGECCPVTIGVSDDEGLTWKPLKDIEREGHFCYMFFREYDGFVYVGYCCEVGMKTQRVVKIPLAEIQSWKPLPAEKVFDNVGDAETHDRDLTAADFKTSRADGKFDSSLGWALDSLRTMRPEYDFDKLADKSEMPAWRGKIRSKLKELLQIRDDLSVPFKRVSSEPRDGYTLEKYEFSPYGNLVTHAWMLVPDAAKKPGAKVPAVVCMPGNGSSLESLTGEPDANFIRYPVRNKQAWYYAKAGLVAIAMENPASANNSVKGIDYNRVQSFYFELMQVTGRSTWGLATEQVLMCVDFLKRRTDVDAKRIVASGMSLGCFSTLYASVLSDDICAVVYNDFACSWAQRYMCTTERPSAYSAYAARDMFGSYRWFDDQPDLMAALAPRPLFLVEDGHGHGCVDKVRRAYRLAGKPENLRFRRYEKFADDAVRVHDAADLRTTEGLDNWNYMVWSNVDPSQHSFHPDVVLPWLCGHLGVAADFSDELKNEIANAVQEREHFAYAPPVASATAPERTFTPAVDLSGAERTEQVEGFKRHHFKVDGCAAWIVAPTKPIPGNRWTWEMEFPGAFGERTGAMKLVRRGFYNAHIVVGNNYACPASMKHFDAFWKFMVARGFDRKCTPMGYSRGGFYGMRFAIAHPDRVHSVYGDAPVCDFKSWPGGKGCGKGAPADWANLIRVYGFANEAEAIAWKGNPISNLQPLALEDVPLIFVVGDTDRAVPPCENAELVETRYKAMGGTVHMFHKPGVAHHPHGLEDPTPVLDLIQKYATED